MTRLISICALALLFLAPDLSAQFADEGTFNQAQAKRLHEFAEKAFKKGFPRKAKLVWLQLLAEYDPDYADAHESLGHVLVGKSWNPRTDFKYPTEDTPNPAAAKSLKRDWENLAKQVGSAHRKLAEDYAKAGRTDRSRYHFEKTIRYLPDDEAAKAALDHKPVEGLSGTDLEKTLYERSKLIEAAIEAQFKVDYPVEELPASDRSEVLDNARIDHKSVKSEHFIFRGDFDLENMKESARHAERAIRVVCEVFKDAPGFFTDADRWPISEVLFVSSQEVFQQVLDANTDRYQGDQKDYEWTREHSSSANLKPNIRLVAAGTEKVMYDSAVRRVAQMTAGLQTTAMNEGIGHTIVGAFFNNNRLFSIDRRRQIETSTEDEIEYNSPNFDEWKDLALESAWKKAGTPAAELTLYQAHDFPNEARIKAWSFCDYLVRRDPQLIKSLDGLNKATNLHNPTDIAERFAEINEGLTIAQLEKEWRDFWTEASPVLKAIRNNTPPLESVSKDVKKWLEAFNEVRKDRGSPAVTWSATYSTRCADHARYLMANKDQRGPGPEQMQDTDLEGATHLGNMFAQMALIETKAKNPKDVFEEWLDHPGYRDALINDFLWTIGLYAEKGVLVMEAIRGVKPGKSKREGAGFTFYPRGVEMVPHEVEVEALGPELRALLEANGHGDKKKVGYPISFHGFGSSLVGERNTYQCSLVGPDKKPVEGILDLGAASGSNRHTSAPGMVVFYPLEPLKKGGARYEVSWSFARRKSDARGESNRDIERVSGWFKTK